MNSGRILIFLVVLLLLHPRGAEAFPRQFSEKSVIDGKIIQVGAVEKKGLVVVFLSALCPCSNSHLVELKSLSQDYPDFEFIGVHSNTDEDQATSIKYFERVALPFPVIRDSGAKLADQFKALKTPHAYIVASDGSAVYQGGVSSSMHFEEDVDRKYLREALSDLSQGKKVRTPMGRTLGCVITRGGKDVW